MNVKIYPLKFFPIYKEKVWGGRKLKELGKELPENKKIGEIWELADRPDEVSIVSNGHYLNKSLKEVIFELKTDLMGTERQLDKFGRFPLLIKYIDASDNLSVQVHPDDVTAEKFKESDPGKTEFWYILDTQNNSKILYGCDPAIKNLTDQKELSANLKLFNFMDIRKGDLIFIPAGTVHALLAKTAVLEIQQNSDVTYRLYDWDRVDESGMSRTLHFDKAMESIKTVMHSDSHKRIVDFNEPHCTVVKSKYFRVELIKAKKTIATCDGKSFKILAVVEGSGYLRYGINFEHELVIKKTDIILLPASLGYFSVESLQGSELTAFLIS